MLDFSCELSNIKTKTITMQLWHRKCQDDSWKRPLFHGKSEKENIGISCSQHA